MPATTRLLKALAIVPLAILFASPDLPAQSNNLMPTADQLDLLRNLSPEERDGLLRRFGLDPSSSQMPQSGNMTPGSQGMPMSSNGQMQPFLPMTQDEATVERERTYLKGGDTLLIEVDFDLPEPPQPIAYPAAAAATAPGAGGPAGTPGGLPTPAVQPRAETEKTPLTAEEQQSLQGLIDQVRERNPYQLSPDGVLTLPGLRGIELAGLSATQATLRIQAEPAFNHLEVRAIRLPLDKWGPSALRPFGYALFERSPSTFAPGMDVPMPANYVVGPGDELSVQLYGNDNRTFSVTVDREGAISFPKLGPINVGGQSFLTVKQEIESRVQSQLIGVQARVSMGATRSIQVFVLGEAKYPGSYTLSGLGTVTSALYAAGGVKPVGSLRNVQLKRQGRLVTTLDLYDLLLRGDTAADAKLLPGDVIFVPPVGPTVSVYGEVQRPAIYELRGQTSVSELVTLAGGLTPEADTSKASLTQVDANRQRIVHDVDLVGESGRSQWLRTGDLLQVRRLRPSLDSAVGLEGHVFAPGVVAYRDGLRLSDVITTVDELRPGADIHYLVIRRELPPNRRIAVVSADLAAALAAPHSAADPELSPHDRIMVFDLASSRNRIIEPLLEELRVQSAFEHPTEIVRIEGSAKVPGDYPLEPGMTVSDLIRAGGGLQDAAYGGMAELSRYSVGEGESRRTQLITIDLAAAVRGDAAADIVLRPFDSLSIKEVPDWQDQEQVTLEGEVRFPGKYSLKRGETLNSVLARAGGLTDYAFPQGTVFTRLELKEREQQQLDVLAARLQNDLATMALQGVAANQAQAASALTVGQSLLSQLRASKAVGRLVINLPRTMQAQVGSQDDLQLRGGDVIAIPKRPQEVTVIGEVHNATSHLYRDELSRNDYINLSGGASRKADRRNTYVVRADGSVIANQGSRWFSRGDIEMAPGDTVVVPLDTERMPALPFWQAVTQILYHLAISAAAVNSF